MDARTVWSCVADRTAVRTEEHNADAAGRLFGGTLEVLLVLLLSAVILIINIELFLF